MAVSLLEKEIGMLWKKGQKRFTVSWQQRGFGIEFGESLERSYKKLSIFFSNVGQMIEDCCVWKWRSMSG